MTRKAATVSRFGSATIESDRVQALRADHPALTEGRTLFPTTVTPSAKSPRFLVSGHNNPKLGKTVLKGPRTGWPIYQLSLEERATCPRSCLQWDVCYGNAMPFARRHTPDANFERYLTAEVITLCREYPEGLLIRLHALGDFYSVEYVYLWARLIAEFPQLHVFGYTAHCIDAEDTASRKIAVAIKALTDGAWDRFAIRTSGGVEERSVTMVIDRPEDIGGFGSDIIICPAQTDKTAACATCGLCWAEAARDKAVAFLKHGMKSRGAAQPKPVPPAINDDFPKQAAGRAGQAALKAKPPKDEPFAPKAVRVAQLLAFLKEESARQGTAEQGLVRMSMALIAKGSGVPAGSLGYAFYELEKQGAVTKIPDPNGGVSSYQLSPDHRVDQPEPQPVAATAPSRRHRSTICRAGGKAVPVEAANPEPDSAEPAAFKARVVDLPLKAKPKSVTRFLMGDPPPGRTPWAAA